jgi:hypothetical protein
MITLPTPAVVTFETTLPSNGKKVKYRPFLMKEEKVLMIAYESADQGEKDGQKQIMDALRSVLQSCILSDLDIDTLPAFDLEWLFLKVRIQSVGSMVRVGLRHGGDIVCDAVTEVDVDLAGVQMDKDPEHKMFFDMGGGFGVQMRYPTADVLEKIADIGEGANVIDILFEIIAVCVEQIVGPGDVVYDTKDLTSKQVSEWLMHFSRAKLEEINESFFGKMPSLNTEVKWVCKKCQTDQVTPVKGIMDFFV